MRPAGSSVPRLSAAGARVKAYHVGKGDSALAFVARRPTVPLSPGCPSSLDLAAEEGDGLSDSTALSGERRPPFTDRAAHRRRAKTPVDAGLTAAGQGAPPGRPSTPRRVYSRLEPAPRHAAPHPPRLDAARRTVHLPDSPSRLSRLLSRPRPSNPRPGVAEDGGASDKEVLSGL